MGIRAAVWTGVARDTRPDADIAWDNFNASSSILPDALTAPLGEALAVKAFEGLARYEVHLDRKLERTLAMLLKLQDLRRAGEASRSVSQKFAGLASR